MFRRLSLLRRIGHTENFPASVLQQAERYQLGKPLVLYKPHVISLEILLCSFFLFLPAISLVLTIQKYSWDFATYQHDLLVDNNIIWSDQNHIVSYNTTIIPFHEQKLTDDKKMLQSDSLKSPYDVMTLSADQDKVNKDNIALQNDNKQENNYYHFSYTQKYWLSTSAELSIVSRPHLCYG